MTATVKTGTTTAKPVGPAFDRVKHLPIEELGDGDNKVFRVKSVTGKVLGAYTDRSKAETLRDSVDLSQALS